MNKTIKAKLCFIFLIKDASRLKLIGLVYYIMYLINYSLKLSDVSWHRTLYK